MTIGLDSPRITFGYAARSTRLFGQLIDGVIAAVPLLIATFVSIVSAVLGAAGAIAGVLWIFFYYFLADGLPGGQSLAKRWLGIRVVSAKTGAPCSFGQSFIRNLLLGILGPLDWIFIFGERHQRLGDMAAGTIVVDAD